MAAKTEVGTVEVKTIKDPVRLLGALKRNSLFIGIGAVLFVFSLANGALSDSQITLSSHIRAGAFLASNLLLIVLFAFGIKLQRMGAELVKRWCKHGLTEKSFPRDVAELESYRFWLYRKFATMARGVTYWFDMREESNKRMQDKATQRPALPSFPTKITPENIDAIRTKHRKEIVKIYAEHAASIKLLIEDHEIKKKGADENVARLTEFWKLIVDLGNFYGINVMPKNEDGEPFEDWNKFREFVRWIDKANKEELATIPPVTLEMVMG